MNYQQADGSRLSVTLSSIELSNTYSGILEGSRERASAYLRERLIEDYPSNQPNSGLALILPDRPELPPWRCVASVTGPVIRPGSDYSQLKVCWFVDAIDLPAPELLIACLAALDWHALALACFWD